jgi:hypothetical protein
MFVKLALILITINAFVYFLYGGPYQNSQSLFASIPQPVVAGQTITSSSQIEQISITGDVNSSSNISAGTSTSTINIPYLTPFLSIAGLVAGFFNSILFGYFYWLGELLPWPIAYAISIPLFIVQAIGLLFLFQMIISAFASVLLGTRVFG